MKKIWKNAQRSIVLIGLVLGTSLPSFSMENSDYQINLASTALARMELDTACKLYHNWMQLSYDYKGSLSDIEKVVEITKPVFERSASIPDIWYGDFFWEISQYIEAERQEIINIVLDLTKDNHGGAEAYKIARFFKKFPQEDRRLWCRRGIHLKIPGVFASDILNVLQTVPATETGSFVIYSKKLLTKNQVFERIGSTGYLDDLKTLALFEPKDLTESAFPLIEPLFQYFSQFWKSILAVLPDMERKNRAQLVLKIAELKEKQILIDDKKALDPLSKIILENLKNVPFSQAMDFAYLLHNTLIRHERVSEHDKNRVCQAILRLRPDIRKKILKDVYGEQIINSDSRFQPMFGDQTAYNLIQLDKSLSSISAENQNQLFDLLLKHRLNHNSFKPFEAMLCVNPKDLVLFMTILTEKAVGSTKELYMIDEIMSYGDLIAHAFSRNSDLKDRTFSFWESTLEAKDPMVCSNISRAIVEYGKLFEIKHSSKLYKHAKKMAKAYGEMTKG